MHVKKQVVDQNVIGIDLGTTNSVAAIMKNGHPHIIKNEFGDAITPSIVHVTENGFLVGKEAKKFLLTDPKNTIYASKRLIGRKFDDIEISKYKENLPYGTKKICNGDIWITTDFGKFSPTQIASKILSKIKEYSSKALGVEIQRAVITVPAYFNDSQRQATKDAGRIAGLDVIRIVNEPTSASLAYGVDNMIDTFTPNNYIAVYDLGGGTFDISILELTDGIFHVKSTNGNTFLGGEDFDNEFIKLIKNLFLEKEGANLNIPKDSYTKLKKVAEKAKIDLSTKSITKIFIENFAENIDLDLSISRNQLESVIKRIAMKTVEPCQKAIADAKIKKDDIRKIVLVGGMTRMPFIKELVSNIFENKNIVSHDSDGHTINPDEAVAKGAAIQAGVLAGTVDNILLLDVVPLSLGIETVGGVFNKIINRNTTIPFKQTEEFTTSEDDQTEVSIRIFQGERGMVENNKQLGVLKVQNIPKAKRGVPRISVTFEADANGILKVYAENSGKKDVVEIVPSSGLTEEEIQRYVAESEANKEADALKKSRIEFIERNNKDLERILSEDIPSSIRKKIFDLQNFMNDSTKFNLAEATNKLKSIKGFETK